MKRKKNPRRQFLTILSIFIFKSSLMVGLEYQSTRMKNHILRLPKEKLAL